jgi:hypothetical protein
MLESRISTMQVCQKVFGALGQVQDGFQIDNLAGCRSNAWERAAHQLKILDVSF